MGLIEEYLQKEKELRELAKKIQSIFIHPGVWSNVEHDQKEYLKKEGWICVNHMVPVESYHGFGSTWMKDCSREERDKVKEELDRIEENLNSKE